MRRTLRARQQLFMEGDEQTHVYLVKTGAVCLYRMLRNGRRQVVGFKLPGDFVALGADPHYRCYAEAIGPTELRSFQTWAFHAAAALNARFMLRLYEAVGRDLTRSQEQAVSVGKRDADGSVAAFLLSVAGRLLPGEGRGTMSLPMSRADIADYLGLSLETVSRVFTGFKRLGFISLRGRRGVQLVDRAALRAVADAGGDNGAPARLLN